MIPHILTENSLTVVINGQAQTMNSDHPAWEQAKDALKSSEWDRLEKMFDVSHAVEDYLDSDANIEVKEGNVFYGGESVHNYCVDKILDFMREGLPYQPLVKFLGKLMANPSRRATEELYRFLEHKSMPLTPEGNFLAYKGVTNEVMDFHTRSFSNKVGDVLEMRRNGVCDDANVGCSAGFHAGSYEYAKGYCHGGGHLMIVKIDPSDVVSVPHDCDCQKLRTCKYEVVSLHETIETPLDDGLNSEYGDYSDWDEDEDVSDDWNEGYAAGYDEATKIQ